MIIFNIIQIYMMLNMRVAIIGMGTAGVSVLRQLVKHKDFKQLKVDVYDNEFNMGQGVPFQNDSSQLLINLPKKMSLNLDDDEEFWKWYQTQSDFTFKNPKYKIDLFWPLYEIILIKL